MIDKEDSCKNRRVVLLKDLINEIQKVIIKNNIRGEDKRKIFIYSRLAEYTYYSEVSIRKFFSGIVPKDITGFLNGVMNYATHIGIDDEYLKNFIKEYTLACSAIIIKNTYAPKVKNNLEIQNLNNIIRINSITKELDSFFESKNKICYVSGYKLSGKTTSILAYIYDIINSKNTFEYIIWNDIGENDKDKIIENSLNVMLNKKDYNVTPNLEKTELFFELLKNNKILLIIDTQEIKFEESFIEFLAKISKYTKIIIISSAINESFNNVFNENCSYVSLNSGMEKDELIELIKLQPKLNSLLQVNSDIIDTLYELTNGVPYPTIYLCKKMVEESMYGKSLYDIISEYKKFTSKGFDYLIVKIIDEIWNDLSKEARKIIAICSIFPYSVSLKLVEYVSGFDMQSDRWKSALNECYSHELLTYVIALNPRVKMNNLIRSLVRNKISQKDDLNFQIFFQSITNYYINITSTIKECYNDLEKMKIMDEKDEFNIVLYCLDLLYSNKKYEEYITISKNLKYYTYVRGYWLIGEKSLELKRYLAAKQINDINNQIVALCDYINRMSKQKNEKEAKKYIDLAKKIMVENNDIKRRVIALYNHVNGLYLYNCCNKYKEALNYWKINKKDYWNDISKYRHLVNTLWIDKCNLKLEDNIEKLYNEVLSNYYFAVDKKFTRGIIDYQLLLCNILLKPGLNNENVIKIERWLSESKYLLDTQSCYDIRNEAEYYRILTLVSKYKKDDNKMHQAISKAIEKYKILGSKKDIVCLENEIKQ